MKAYCINLDRKPENFTRVCAEFSGILDIHRVSGIDAKQMKIEPGAAVYKTQLSVFAQAMQTQDKYLILIEDDIHRTPAFDSYWPEIVNFISTETGWDFISLDVFLCLDPVRLIDYNSFLYRTTSSRSLGFMIYNMNFLRKNFHKLGIIYPLDRTITSDPNFIKLTPKELLIRQDVKKYSDTALTDTSVYEVFYEETIKILKERMKSPRPPLKLYFLKRKNK